VIGWKKTDKKEIGFCDWLADIFKSRNLVRGWQKL